jgi:hypothetical protein
MDRFSNLKDEVVLSYSGGTDSTLSAIYLLNEFRKVALLTIWPHNFLFFRKKAEKLVYKLKEKYDDGRVSHKFLDGRELFNKFRGGGNIFADIYRYGFFERITNFCVPCGLTMTTTCFIYCLENGIPYFAKGINALQGSKDYGQSPLNIKNLMERANELGIELLLPVYHNRGTDEELFKLGIIPRADIQSNRTILTGYPFLRPTQGTCLLLPIQTFYKIGIASPIFGTGKIMEETRKFSQPKHDTFAKDYIAQYFQKKGLDIDNTIENLRKSRSRQEEKLTQLKLNQRRSIINIEEINFPKRIVMDDIALLVILADLLISSLAVILTRSISLGLMLFLFTWCIFIYNHMTIRIKFKGDQKSFIFRG